MMKRIRESGLDELFGSGNQAEERDRMESLLARLMLLDFSCVFLGG